MEITSAISQTILSLKWDSGEMQVLNHGQAVTGQQIARVPRRMQQMQQLMALIMALMHRVPGQVYLWVAILIFGASGAVTRKLTQIGAANFVGGRNPISLCNVLFVGNLCALAVLLLLYRQQWRWAVLRQVRRREWVSLVIAAILAGALAPGLIFQALALTPVNTVVLLGRLEPPLALALSVWLLGERVNRWEVLGAIAGFVGVGLTVLLQPMTPEPMLVMGNTAQLGQLGQWLAVVGAIVLAIATIIGKRDLSRVPLGLYSIVRTGLGTLVFFVVALVLYGQDHFTDVLSPFLWRWMLVYGVMIVVVGQSFWLAGLRLSSVSTAAIVSSFVPIAGIGAAYLILGETPTLAQYIGGSIIVLGIVLSQVGVWRQTTAQQRRSHVKSAQMEQSLTAAMGFKGI